MLPAIAGIAARAGLSTLGRGAATNSARTSVQAAASSGTISAGTATGTTGSRMLSAAQFGASAYNTARGDRTVTQTAPPAGTAPAAGDGLGWARS
ncbi:hypothetical protein [Streptomyces sp. MMBL 11-1]|uniref:hypothetical protein n=1 Tax=Streptomyces sp. MMBL 11-1 TaxID=3026420 RepID=UPI0023621CE5|nr:hypothetical protein [Streptomyces sp. MMBL 11-1]